MSTNFVYIIGTELTSCKRDICHFVPHSSCHILIQILLFWFVHSRSRWRGSRNWGCSRDCWPDNSDRDQVYLNQFCIIQLHSFINAFRSSVETYCHLGSHVVVQYHAGSDNSKLKRIKCKSYWCVSYVQINWLQSSIQLSGVTFHFSMDWVWM
jgi:hypothetical protein